MTDQGSGGRARTAAAALFALALVALPAAGGTRVRDLSGPTPFPKGCGVPGQQTRDAEGEPSVSVNPRDPRNIVVAWQQDRFAVDGGALSNVLAVSKDGGSTWRRILVPKLSRCTGGGDERTSDAWLSFGGDGTLYLASLTFSETPTNEVIAGPTELNVTTSRDGGITWSTPVYVQPFDHTYNDREVVTADPTRPGRAYVVFVKRYGAFGESGIEMFSSTADRAKTWSLPTPIIIPPPGTLTDPALIEALPDGTLLNVALLANLSPFLPDQVSRVPWVIVTSRSTDGGFTWSLPVVVATISPAAPLDPDTGTVTRAYNLVSAAVGKNGMAYITWNEIDSLHGSTIFIARSADEGKTWSAPSVVHREAAQAFIPMIAVDGSGAVGISFDDFRNDRPGDRQLTTDVWLDVSRDSGRTWRETHLAGPFNMLTAAESDSSGVAGLFVGDYQGIAALPSGFVNAFAQARPQSRFGPSDIFVAITGP